MGEKTATWWLQRDAGDVGWGGEGIYSTDILLVQYYI